MAKEITIEVEDGMEIDVENSDLKNGIIKLRKVDSAFSSNWVEFCERNKIVGGECKINDKGIVKLSEDQDRHWSFENYIPNLKLANAFVALMQLMTIRDKEYTHGWEPDYKGNNGGYIIVNYAGRVQLNNLVFNCAPLSFPNEELAEKFINTWKDLIEVAKPLL